MGFFKILGGVALGVGAIAAAPITGGGSLLAAGVGLGGSLAGAGTVAAATAAGAAGAAAGYAASEKSKQEKEKARQDGYERGKGENAKEIAELENIITQKAASYEKRDQFILALFAVGTSIAYADYHISEVEKEDLKLFITGVSSSSFPDIFKEKINYMYQNPPSFEEAMRYVNEYIKREDFDTIDLLINNIAHSDDNVDFLEEEYISKWNTFKSMN